MRRSDSSNVPRSIRAIFGGLVMLVVLAMILNWVGDFREAQRGEGTPSTAESSDEPTTPPDPEGTQSEEPPEDTRTLTVIVDGLNLRAGPDRGTRSLKVLSDGTELRVLQKDGEWYRVEHPDGITGYVMGDEEYVKVE